MTSIFFQGIAWSLLWDLQPMPRCKGCLETTCKGCHETEHHRHARDPMGRTYPLAPEPTDGPAGLVRGTATIQHASIYAGSRQTFSKFNLFTIKRLCPISPAQPYPERQKGPAQEKAMAPMDMRSPCTGMPWHAPTGLALVPPKFLQERRRMRA